MIDFHSCPTRVGGKVGVEGMIVGDAILIIIGDGSIAVSVGAIIGGLGFGIRAIRTGLANIAVRSVPITPIIATKTVGSIFFLGALLFPFDFEFFLIGLSPTHAQAARINL
jgi:hypothetical protein